MRTLEDRVEYGQSVIDQAVDQNDDWTQAVDLLGDLMHWAQAQGLNFDELLASARIHFEAEDEGQDVPTMSDAAYSRAFGSKALALRKARRQTEAN